MFKELLMWFAMPYFKDDLYELQRYRNVTDDLHRWCSKDDSIDKATTLIIAHAKDDIPYNMSSFRNTLNKSNEK